MEIRPQTFELTYLNACKFIVKGIASPKSVKVLLLQLGTTIFVIRVSGFGSANSLFVNVTVDLL